MERLQGSPWLLAHRSMLKPNQPRKFSLLGEDYVLWQDSQGRIQALPNACPHMGAMLSEGWCAPQPDGSSTIVCPFHALAFDRTGCTVLPGSNKSTKSLMQPLELVIENYFPFMGVMHGDNKILSLKECHFYLPETAQRSRVFVLMYIQAHSPVAHLVKRNLLKLVDVVVEQDARILSHIYPNTRQRIKLNNEVGMDWVRRNFEQFPAAAEPNFSR